MNPTIKDALVVDDLHKSFSDRKATVGAVNGVSFSIQEGEFYTLLGPSGCGKTTTMRCIAGLERTNQGRISIAGREVSAPGGVFVPPNERDIGMVFQSYAIWPHMTVFQNVAFPLKVTGIRKGSKEMNDRVEEALALVQLEGLAGRFATQLSGGQQQRLALARALVRRPKLLLLDEPLSNLDARLRDRMRTELKSIQRRLGITTLYVTHDQTEALSMSDRIAVMEAGTIVQEATPLDLYLKPLNSFVAEFLGNSNLLEGRVNAVDREGGCEIDAGFGALSVSVPEGIEIGNRIVVTIRPEHIRLHVDRAAMPNGFAALVESVSFLGEQSECQVVANGVTLRCRVASSLKMQAGTEVWVELPADACNVISGAAA
ncbi:MAG TPA: ABC transporter ATP-binding protein [Candidatus Lustribacter sp.]|nr:ABC transporter ATP-binding protein [Candidatus Lustribacter sp.]